jgi:hypothetical protein
VRQIGALDRGSKCSDGIRRCGEHPRMNKHEQERRDRGTGSRRIEGGGLMRFAGIDVAAEHHVAAMVDATGRVLCKPSAFAG